MKSQIKIYTKINCFKNSIRDDEQMNSLIKSNIDRFNEKEYSFKDSISISSFKIKGKKKIVAGVKEGFDLENILLRSLKEILHRKSNVLFRNRQVIVSILLDKIKILKNLKDFTIVRFDFKNYFNSISSEYVYNKYVSGFNLNKEQNSVLKELILSVPYCTMGLPTSNILAEIISADFDKSFLNFFSPQDVVFYARYVDDGIIILNTKINEDIIKDYINSSINNAYYQNGFDGKNKNKTKVDFSTNKYSYLTKDSPNKKINYLGYLIKLNNELDIELGITDEKMLKYQKKLKSIIKNNYHDIERLRIILKLWTRRVVYTLRNKRDVKAWISKGIIHNYNELRNYNLINSTKVFLKKCVINAFDELGIDMPYYLMKEVDSSYNVYENLIKNRAFILDKNIGIQRDDLIRLIKKVSPLYICNNKSYHELIKELLVNCVVGY